MKQIISLRLEKQGAERRLTVSLPLFFPLSFSHTHFSASSLPIYGGKKNFQYKFKGYRTNKNNKIKYEGVWVEAIQESGYFYPTPIFKNTISNYLCSFHFSNERTTRIRFVKKYSKKYENFEKYVYIFDVIIFLLCRKNINKL